MKKTLVMAMTGLSMMLSSCGGGSNSQAPAATSQGTDDFTYEVDAFADLQILRYQVPEFESLTL